MKGKYICAFSGGKDSCATVILAHEHNEPLDEIVFSEVMFDENTSGELPEHIEFIKEKCIPLFEKWGYKTTILHSDRTYMDEFTRYPTKGKRVGTGLIAGFPMALKCNINGRCKIKPIKQYLKQQNIEKQYIGIAVDEPKRLERLDGNKTSLLAKYNVTEIDAMRLCEKYGLVSPIYRITKRNGCWFCPNARRTEIRHLYDCHRDLFNKLVELEKSDNLIGNMWNLLTNTRITDIQQVFENEDAQMDIFEYMESIKHEKAV